MENCKKCKHPMSEHSEQMGCRHRHGKDGMLCICLEGMITKEDRINAKHARVILTTIQQQAAEIERLRGEVGQVRNGNDGLKEQAEALTKEVARLREVVKSKGERANHLYDLFYSGMIPSYTRTTEWDQWPSVCTRIASRPRSFQNDHARA